MRRSVLRATALALLLGCTTTDGIPTDQGTQVPAAPSALDRAAVIRTHVGFGITEPGNPLLVLIGFAEGVTIADWCAGPAPLSSRSIAHLVFPPSGKFLVASHGRGVPVLVYQTEGDLCDGVGESLLASGTARFHFSHTELTTGRIVDNSGVRGILDLVGGGKALLAVRSPFHLNPDGTVKFDKTRITLTPL
jgi:hypothetical protein